MERMRRHAERFDTRLIQDQVASVDLSGRPFRLFGDSGTYTCDALPAAQTVAASLPPLKPVFRCVFQSTPTPVAG